MTDNKSNPLVDSLLEQCLPSSIKPSYLNFLLFTLCLLPFGTANIRCKGHVYMRESHMSYWMRRLINKASRWFDKHCLLSYLSHLIQF